MWRVIRPGHAAPTAGGEPRCTHHARRAAPQRVPSPASGRMQQRHRSAWRRSRRSR